MYFPEELWGIIKRFQIQYKLHHFKKLSRCHQELLRDDHRPRYKHKRHAYHLIRTAEEALHGTWRKFSQTNQFLQSHPLCAIEVLPRDCQNVTVGDIVLYYGWNIGPTLH